MLTHRGIRVIGTIIVVVTLPSAGALTWYYLTKDPTIRPLGITEAALREYQTGEEIEIIAQIDWDSANELGSRDQFARRLEAAFEAKGAVSAFKFRDTPDQPTQITFRIGHSVLGPFPKSDATGWVNAAVEALRMHAPEKR